MPAPPRDQRAGRRQPPENEVNMSRDHWSHEEDGPAPADEQAPYEPFWVHWGKSITDEQFVERIRKSVLKRNGWRTWLIVVQLSFTLLFLILGGWLHKEFSDRIQGNPWMLSALVPISAGLGFGFGLLLSQSISGLFELLWSNRTNDLLLKYHDIAQQLKHTDHNT